MLVKVRNKEFNIDLVNNEVNRLYQEINETSLEMTQISIDIKSMTAERKKDDRPFTEEETKKIETLSERVKAARFELIDKRWKIIKELMETNGYDFDFDFWNRRTGPEDLNQFVFDCLDVDRAKFTDKENPKKSKKK